MPVRPIGAPIECAAGGLRHAYAHLDGVDVTLLNDHFALDALDSHRLRLCVRLDYARSRTG